MSNHAGTLDKKSHITSLLVGVIVGAMTSSLIVLAVAIVGVPGLSTG